VGKRALFAGNMNWRVITGLTLLLLGVKVLYTTMATTGPAGSTTVYGKLGSIVWIGVGLYLLVKGMTKNEPQ